jgi:hypothetical protein
MMQTMTAAELETTRGGETDPVDALTCVGGSTVGAAGAFGIGNRFYRPGFWNAAARFAGTAAGLVAGDVVSCGGVADAAEPRRRHKGK